MSPTRVIPILLAGALTAPAATGQAVASPRNRLTVDELRGIYLACDDAAAAGQLSRMSVMQCSVVYEELKRRAFDGDFGRLLAWSRSQPPLQRQPSTR
jgi:hypothetical protein